MAVSLSFSRIGPISSADAKAPIEDGGLLQLRRAADQEAGLQILRGGATIGAGDADDAAHRQRGDVAGAAGPADQEEHQAGEHQRGDGHAGDGVRG